MKKITFDLYVDDNFEPGCCHECPLHYEDSFYDEDDGYDYWDSCVFGRGYDECPLREAITQKPVKRKRS